MSDSSQIHRGFMSLSCQFHSYVRFIVDSCHFQPQTRLQWQIRGTLMALSLKLMKVTWIWHEHGIPNFDNLEFKRNAWKRHEYDLLKSDNFGVLEKVPWKWHESGWSHAMKVTWIWHEYDDIMDFENLGVFRGKCHESAMKVSWNSLGSHVRGRHESGRKWHERDPQVTWIYNMTYYYCNCKNFEI